MNWKTTAVFAGLLVAAGAAYLLYTPEGETPKIEEKLLIPDLRPDQVNRIEIARAGEPEMAVEKVSSAPVAAWRILPADKPAEPPVVQAMLDAIGRLHRSGGMDPGTPGTDPALTGLGAPRLSVTFAGEGKRVTVRFGNPPPTNQSAVFCQREGDPRLYLAEADVFDACNKTPAQSRSRRLARFDPHRVVRLDLDDRFFRPRGKGEMEVVYEKSVFERTDQGADKGWHLRKPWEERLDDIKVNLFLSDLSNLLAEEFVAPGDWKAKGLDQPQLVATITVHGAEKPLVVQFGGRTEGGARKDCLYAHAVGSDEVALVERDRFERLPRRRGQFRSDVIFPFPPEVKTMEVEVGGIGKLVLEQRETRTKKDEEDLVTRSWEVVEPKDLRIDRELMERFINNVFIHRIVDFLGEQPDLKLFDLDPPGVVLKLATKDGGTRLYRFGMKGQGPGYLRREDRTEVFEVKPELIRRLRGMDLNFRDTEMYNVSRESLREVRFEWKDGTLEPIYYALKRDPAGKWAFSDKVHEGQEADPDRVGEILSGVNFIRAESFISRDPESAARYRLRDREAAGTLRIVAEGGPAEGRVLYFSRNLDEKPGGFLYAARFEGDPVIFHPNARLVELLKRAPARKKE
jgi:hypothetical protein